MTASATSLVAALTPIGVSIRSAAQVLMASRRFMVVSLVASLVLGAWCVVLGPFVWPGPCLAPGSESAHQGTDQAPRRDEGPSDEGPRTTDLPTSRCCLRCAPRGYRTDPAG